MKTKNLVMAAATLLVAGCSQNEITLVNPDTRPAVGFSTYTGVQTKGTEITESAMHDTHFGILAFYTGAQNWETAKSNVTPNFMYNQKVQYQSGGWTYTPVKYWPSNESEMISFFAYAPYEPTPTQAGNTKGIVLSEQTAKGVPFINFTLKPEGNVGDMVDLVVSNVADQKRPGTSNVSGGIVPFSFKHILSRLTFDVKLKEAFKDADTHMLVKGLSIVGSDRNASSKFYTNAKYADFHWNYDAGTIPTGDYSLANILRKTSPLNIAGYSTPALDVTATAQSLFTDEQYLFLVPVNDGAGKTPDQTGTTIAGEFQLELTYDIATKGSDGKLLTSETKSVVNLDAGALKLGVAYKYTFVLSLDAIGFDVTQVEVWGTEQELPKP